MWQKRDKEIEKEEKEERTLFTPKGILIILAFAVWVNLTVGIIHNTEAVIDTIKLLGQDTLLVVIITYMILLLIETVLGVKRTDRL